jgi:hypothetical protein
MRSLRGRIGVLAAVWTAVRVLSCGGEGSDPNGTPDPDEGGSFSQVITAAEGGDVLTEQEWGRLTIPAGALDSDAEVTLSPVPAEAGSVTSVYVVGPVGVAFDPAARLSIVYDGDPGSGREAVLARFVDGGWAAITGSVASEGRLAGDIPGAGRYAGILRNTPEPVVIDCAQVKADFAPCGGAIPGTWRLAGSCAVGAPFPLPAPDYCPTRTGTWSLEQTGIVSITETSESVFLDRNVRTAQFQAPASCFPDGQSCGDTTLVDEFATSCSKAADGCACTGVHLNPALPTDPVTLGIVGNELVLVDSEGVETSRQPFCVSGTTAVIQATWSPTVDGEPVQVLWVLSR